MACHRFSTRAPYKALRYAQIGLRDRCIPLHRCQRAITPTLILECLLAIERRRRVRQALVRVAEVAERKLGEALVQLFNAAVRGTVMRRLTRSSCILPRQRWTLAGRSNRRRRRRRRRGRRRVKRVARIRLLRAMLSEMLHLHARLVTLGVWSPLNLVAADKFVPQRSNIARRVVCAIRRGLLLQQARLMRRCRV